MRFDLGHDFVNRGLVPFLPWFQDDGQFAPRLARTYAGTASGHILYVFHSRILHQVTDGRFGHVPCTFECGSFRKLQFHLEISLVFYREETGRHHTVKDENQSDDQAEAQNDSFRMYQDFLDTLDVFVVSDGQPFVDFAENDVFRFVRVCRFQDERAHDRTQRQGYYRRNQYRYHNRYGELAVELSRDARQEADRYEDGCQY